MTAASNFTETYTSCAPYSSSVWQVVHRGSGDREAKVVGLESRLGMGRAAAQRGCVRRGWSRAGRELQSGLVPMLVRGRGGAWRWQKCRILWRNCLLVNLFCHIPTDELMDGIILAGLLHPFRMDGGLKQAGGSCLSTWKPTLAGWRWWTGVSCCRKRVLSCLLVCLSSEIEACFGNCSVTGSLLQRFFFLGVCRSPCPLPCWGDGWLPRFCLQAHFSVVHADVWDPEPAYVMIKNSTPFSSGTG